MTIEELIREWLGKQLEVAGSANAKYQCVDLANAYFRDVLGFPIIEWTNAVDFPEKADRKLFDWIENTPDAVIQKGDVPVWNGKVGKGAGHIAIALEGANIASFKSFDQNWSKPLYCTIENHSYSNVRGWLRPKKKSTGETFKEYVTTVHQMVTDILLGLKKTTSENEITAWKEIFVNPMQMVEEIVNRDETFKKSVASPYLEEQQRAHNREILALKNAESTEKEKIEETWQAKLTTASENYGKLEEKYNNLVSGNIKTVSFWDFLRIKFGGEKNA